MNAHSFRSAIIYFSFLLPFITIVSCGKNHLEKGEICLNLGDYDNAICFFNKALKKNPDSFRIRRNLAMAWLQKSSTLEMEHISKLNDWQQTVHCFEHALKLEETDELKSRLAYSCYRFAKALDRAKDSTGALRAAMKSVRLQPINTQMLNYAAILNYRNGKTKTAYDLFLQTSVVDSTDATAFFNLGMLHWYSDELLEAYRWWLKALAVDPDDETIQYWFARADLKMREKVK